jgi:hypothetical protein
MIAAVLTGLGAALALLTIGLRGDRLSGLVPTGLVAALVSGSALATALGSALTGRWHAVFIVLGLVAAAVGGNHVTLAVFDAIDGGHEGHEAAGLEPDGQPGQPEQSGQPGPPGQQSQPAPDPGSLRAAGTVLRGGAWIGILERLAIFATLAARWPEGIAVVLAVKGLGRYPELRAAHRPGLAERFIIGTLVSVLWAALCAYAATGPALG